MDTVEFFRDSTNHWRWHRQSEGNNEIIGAASEGFDSYRNAFDNAYRNYGNTVHYVKWPIDDTGDEYTRVGLEVHDDDGSSPED